MREVILLMCEMKMIIMKKRKKIEVLLKCNEILMNEVLMIIIMCINNIIEILCMKCDIDV